MVLLFSALSASSALGKSSETQSFLTRPYLTGDWGGGRTFLAEHGVAFDFRYSSSYQGLSSGTGDKDFDYGGKVDAFINLDSAKMGRWEGGGFCSHIEYNHGDAPTNLGGALFSVNTALFWPVGALEEVVATATQW